MCTLFGYPKILLSFVHFNNIEKILIILYKAYIWKNYIQKVSLKDIYNLYIVDREKEKNYPEKFFRIADKSKHLLKCASHNNYL